jgi:hypothetical protein
MTTTSEIPPSSPSNAGATTIVRTGQPRESLIKRIIGFIGWVLSGFGLFSVRRQHSKSEEIVLYAVHQAFYLWALILVGFIGGACVRHWPNTGGAWGWIYVWMVLYTLVTLLYDMNTMKFLLWVGIFSFLWLIGRYLQDMQYIPVLTHVAAMFRGLHPHLDPGFAMVLSIILAPAWVISLFQTFSWGRKKFSPNSIEEWYLGEGTEVTDRSGLKFRMRYRDIFETILGLGAGDLEAMDGSGKVVKRWPNILFLAFTWNSLDEILHQRAATVDNPTNDPVEVEQVRRT